MKRVAIIGAGLAGTSCAYVLKHNGFDPVIYEAGPVIAPGASGNSRGLYNPRLGADLTPESEFYSAAFFKALDVFSDLNNIDWNPCGAVHLITDDKKDKRFRQCAVNWGWGDDDMRVVTAAQASAIAGIEIGYDALFLPRSGFVSPRKLCEAYAQGIEIHLNTDIKSLDSLQADAIILANGMGASRFLDLPLRAVRGQITDIAYISASRNLKTNLCYGGYITPASDDLHMVGSTFQRWLDHSQIMIEDDTVNIDKMMQYVPALRGDYNVLGHRAGIRTTTADHVPVIGAVAGHNNLYVSTAHGSHGIISSLMGAHLLTQMIGGEKLSLSAAVMAHLSPSRYTL
jgi:tRNA 5-methylaminomethyl-2-thiouridine biosynthesis bifunctional protein